jgi:hypothetical protein
VGDIAHLAGRLLSGAGKILSSVVIAPRALVGLLMIGTHLFAAIGFPNFQLPVGKDQSEPFPCQSRACGCRTADQCRRSCCCFNRQEKIAWATRHGVSLARVLPQETSACSNDTESLPVTKKKSCCEAPARKSGKGPAPPRRIDWVLGFQALECGAHGVDWMQGGGIALPAAVEFEIQAPLVCAACVVDSQFCPSPELGRLERPG